jgi:hypothetical protein
MKQGCFKAVCLLILASLAATSAFGDEHTVDYESLVLEAFDGNTAHEYVMDGNTFNYEFEWKLDASKFATKTDDITYPQMAYVPSWPMALFGQNRENRELKSLGIWGRFDRRGYNWIDVYPVKSGGGDDDEAEPFEIPIPGRISYMDLWVWGSNLDFYLEAYLRDHEGVVHNIYMGNIGHTGWKNIRARIPNNVKQSKRILPRLAGLSFVKFRIWTQPTEKVHDFYVYLDQFKVLTDVFESLYDGDELANPERVQELWAGNN